MTTISMCDKDARGHFGTSHSGNVFYTANPAPPDAAVCRTYLTIPKKLNKELLAQEEQYN
jgi:hypothetical protein